MKMVAKDGKLYAEVTLRDVVERTEDLSDSPILSEIKRLYDENEKLRELVEYMHRCFVRGHDWGPYCEGETVWVEQRMRDLGIEVDE